MRRLTGYKIVAERQNQQGFMQIMYRNELNRMKINMPMVYIYGYINLPYAT